MPMWNPALAQNSDDEEPELQLQDDINGPPPPPGAVEALEAAEAVGGTAGGVDGARALPHRPSPGPSRPSSGGSRPSSGLSGRSFNRRTPTPDNDYAPELQLLLKNIPSYVSYDEVKKACQMGHDEWRTHRCFVLKGGHLQGGKISLFSPLFYLVSGFFC